MILETISVGPMQVNCYILAKDAGAKAIIIDPGAEERKIRKVLDKHQLTPGLVVNTHGHYDHIGADDKFNVPVYVHGDDLKMLKDPMLNLSGFFSLPYQVKSEIKTLKENDLIELDGIRLKVLHIPGHTRGGIALLMEEPGQDIVFTGDSLFCLGIGRSDLNGGDGELLVKSINEKLLNLPENTKVYPGHGLSSVIKQEKEGNPYL